MINKLEKYRWVIYLHIAIMILAYNWGTMYFKLVALAWVLPPLFLFICLHKTKLRFALYLWCAYATNNVIDEFVFNPTKLEVNELLFGFFAIFVYIYKTCKINKMWNTICDAIYDTGELLMPFLVSIKNFVVKFIPITALFGILTRIAMDVRQKKATIRGAFISLFGSSVLVYIGSPIIAKYVTSIEWFGFFSFVLGFTAMQIIAWVEERDKVRKWLDLIEDAVINLFKKKMK